MMGWTPLPDSGIEVRETDEGGFWRHEERIPDPEGVGPYASAEDAARDGADYALFVAGK